MKTKYSLITSILVIFVGLLIFTGGVSLIVLGITILKDGEQPGKEVDCYDKNDNKIMGVVCYDEPLTIEELWGNLIFSVIVGLFLLWVSASVIYIFFINGGCENY